MLATLRDQSPCGPSTSSRRRAPRQIAAERGEQHSSNLQIIRSLDADRRGKGKRHDDSEQYLGDPLHGAEYAKVPLVRLIRHFG